MPPPYPPPGDGYDYGQSHGYEADDERDSINHQDAASTTTRLPPIGYFAHPVSATSYMQPFLPNYVPAIQPYDDGFQASGAVQYVVHQPINSNGGLSVGSVDFMVPPNSVLDTFPGVSYDLLAGTPAVDHHVAFGNSLASAPPSQWSFTQPVHFSDISTLCDDQSPGRSHDFRSKEERRFDLLDASTKLQTVVESDGPGDIPIGLEHETQRYYSPGGTTITAYDSPYKQLAYTDSPLKGVTPWDSTEITAFSGWSQFDGNGDAPAIATASDSLQQDQEMITTRFTDASDSEDSASGAESSGARKGQGHISETIQKRRSTAARSKNKMTTRKSKRLECEDPSDDEETSEAVQLPGFLAGKEHPIDINDVFGLIAFEANVYNANIKTRQQEVDAANSFLNRTNIMIGKDNARMAHLIEGTQPAQPTRRTTRPPKRKIFEDAEPEETPNRRRSSRFEEHAVPQARGRRKSQKTKQAKNEAIQQHGVASRSTATPSIGNDDMDIDATDYHSFNDMTMTGTASNPTSSTSVLDFNSRPLRPLLPKPSTSISYEEQSLRHYPGLHLGRDHLPKNTVQPLEMNYLFRKVQQTMAFAEEAGDSDAEGEYD